MTLSRAGVKVRCRGCTATNQFQQTDVKNEGIKKHITTLQVHIYINYCILTWNEVVNNALDVLLWSPTLVDGGEYRRYILLPFMQVDSSCKYTIISDINMDRNIQIQYVTNYKYIKVYDCLQRGNLKQKLKCRCRSSELDLFPREALHLSLVYALSLCMLVQLHVLFIAVFSNMSVRTRKIQ